MNQRNQSGQILMQKGDERLTVEIQVPLGKAPYLRICSPPSAALPGSQEAQ